VAKNRRTSIGFSAVRTGVFRAPAPPSRAGVPFVWPRASRAEVRIPRALVEVTGVGACMIPAGKKEFRPASGNSDCLARDYSASSDSVSIPNTVVPLRIDE
jgi:hypothetical protein